MVFMPLFSNRPWILALFPPVLTVRGGIGGIFSGNLATMLHLGMVKPQIRDNTESYWGLVKSVLVITTIDTMVLGVMSFILCVLSGAASWEMLPIFLIVPTVACMLAVCFSIPVTSFIAIETFRRGLDPDILVYPILASVNDIVVTAFYVITVSLVIRGGFLFTALGAVFVVILAAVGYLASMNRDDTLFTQTLSEGTFIVVISSVFGSVNGVILSSLSGSLASIPGLMVMYPALTNALGNIGAIIGSQTTTNMALGYAKSFFEELRHAGRNIIQVELPAFLMHGVFAVFSFLIAGPSTPGVSLVALLGIALTSNLISFGVISVFALFSAHQAFQRGLNPDNVVIPAITSVSDTTATLAVTPAITIIKMLGL
ncbi:MAG: magnesium transporter [Candidatus Bathyarchaeota archaeon]|nr:magnesium transporter [Candidatus Bathyarchaeota archaeon]